MDRRLRLGAERSARAEAEALRLDTHRSCGQAGIDMAALLVGWAQRHAVSSRCAEDLCQTLRTAQQMGLLSNGEERSAAHMTSREAEGSFVVPGRWQTAEARAKAQLHGEQDLPRRVTTVEVSDLRQLQKAVTIAAHDVLDTLQCILKDKRIPSS